MAEEQKPAVKPFPVSDRYLRRKRRAIRLLWCDRLTIIDNAPKTSRITHITTFEPEEVITDEPCRIVSQTVDSATDGEPARAYKTINVMFDENVDAKPGCRIRVVTQNGKIFEGKQTGQAIRKSDSQTVTVEIEKDYA